MKLNERYDGSDSTFEGERTLIWRSLPANARVTKAIVLLTPQQSTVGELFEERITFTDGQGNWGATKIVGIDFVEVDLHRRRTLTTVMGATTNANLQVDLGGGAYVEINDKGAIKAPDDTLFSVPIDGKLPALIVTKFKLTATATNTKPNVSQVTVRSVPTNVSVRIGNLPPFWTHLGELTGDDVSPDFSAILQAFLSEAKTENGFYNLPLILHSDTIARLQVTLDIEYQVEANVMPQGLNEVQLPYDFSSLPKAQENVLQIAVPPNMRVAANGVTARVRGAFEETRIVYGATGAVTVAGTVDISPALSQAQIISLSETLKATAVDLFMVVTQAAKLQLDVLEDLDGKPSRVSLLPKPVQLMLSAPVGTTQDNKIASELRWVSVVLPVEFQFQMGQHYWLVLQSLEGQAAWNVAPALAGVMGMQHTKDSGLSWRDTLVAGISGAANAFFRLRQKPARFETPIEFQVGSDEHAIRVNLNRFQPLGRVDFALDFEEIGTAFNQYLDKVSPSTACPEIEHLANWDFEKWYRIGESLSLQASVKLDFYPAAIAIHPDWTRAYAVGDKDEAGHLQVIDVMCNQKTDSALDLSVINPVNGIVLSPDGTRAYVHDNSQLLIIDTNIPAVLGVPLLIRHTINTFALSPDGSRLYVAEYFFNSTSPRGAVRVIDTTKLEQAVIKGNSNLATVTIGEPIDLGFGQRPTHLMVSPDGSRLYLVIKNATGAGIHIFDTGSLKQLGNPLLANQQHDAIALTPDGKWLVVANANSISMIDTALGIVVGSDILLDGNPKALVISPEGSRAYVIISLADDFILRVIDLTRNAVIPITDIGLNSVALVLTPQGDKIYVPDSELQSISCIQIGDRLPVDWNYYGWVTPVCLPNPCHLIAVLGLSAKKDRQRMASALSQVVPVVSACAYEFSFWGIAEPDAAMAEVIWISKECGQLRTDKIPIQALEQQKGGVIIKSNALMRAVANTDANPQLILHRIRLTAPTDAVQAEVRFSVLEGVVAGIDRVSLMATNETVANADLSLQQDNRIADWMLVPNLSSGVSLVAGTEGIQLRNAGAESVELIQVCSIKGNAPFAVEFQGKAITRSSAKTNPRIELRWLKADTLSAGSTTVLEILPTNVGSTLGSGISPNEANQVEIHLVVSGGTTLEIKRVSLRFSVPALVPVTFVAQAPGELTVSDFKVAFEQAEVAKPAIPVTGLCPSTLPSRQAGETSNNCCFCLCCESEQTMTEITAMETPSGRPALVGRCADCGSNMVRFGGQRVPDAQPFSLVERGVSQPIVLHPIAHRIITTTKQQLKAEPKVTIPLTAINGIGEARVQQLVTIGIDSIEKLATAVPEDVVKALKVVSFEKAAELIEKAKQLSMERVQTGGDTQSQ